MTELSESELRIRLRDLCVPPPNDGFESALRERLDAEVGASPGTGRVVSMSGWLRRRRVAVALAAAAFPLAAAAAAAVGGWLPGVGSSEPTPPALTHVAPPEPTVSPRSAPIRAPTPASEPAAEPEADGDDASGTGAGPKPRSVDHVVSRPQTTPPRATERPSTGATREGGEPSETKTAVGAGAPPEQTVPRPPDSAGAAASEPSGQGSRPTAGRTQRLRLRVGDGASKPEDRTAPQIRDRVNRDRTGSAQDSGRNGSTPGAERGSGSRGARSGHERRERERHERRERSQQMRGEQSGRGR